MPEDKKDNRLPPRYTNGPVVKSGPNAGKNRSRRDDGRWHAKRSDAGKSRSNRSKAGCFVSTAACAYMGLPDDCHELQVLRRFRDDVLLESAMGRAMVDLYYEVAPAIAAKLADPADLQGVWEAVRECVAAIEHGNTEHALATYVTTIHALSARYDKSAA
jgi:hypothetical protein